MKWFHAVLAGLWMMTACVAAPVMLPEGSGVFAHPKPDAPMIGALPRPMNVVVSDRTYGWLDKDHMTRRFLFYEFEVAPGKKAYVTPEIVLKNGAKQYRTIRRSFHWMMPGLAAGLLLVLMVFSGMKYRNLSDRNKVFFWMVTVMSVRLLLASWMIFRVGDVFQWSSDEVDFFVIGKDVAKLQISGTWPRSWGQGLFYGPLIALVGAVNMYELLEAASLANLLLGCMGVGLLVLILRRLGGSVRQAAAGGLAYAVLPLFCYRMENWRLDFARGFFAWPEWDWSFQYYQNMTWNGFNAMSDTPSLFLVLLLILLSLQREKNVWRTFGLGTLLGVCCLFRINNIFYAPVAAFCFLAQEPFAWRRWSGYLIAGLTGFFLVFSTQLYLNYTQFGSISTFPYVLYENTAQGFTLSMIPRNVPVLFGANAFWFIGGGVALLWLSKIKIQITLALWIVPTLIFFAGYYHTRDDAVRFVLPLFPAFISAAALCHWTWRRALCAALPALTACFFPLVYLSVTTALLAPSWILIRESLRQVRTFRLRRTASPC